jgi:CelD/BcsL family acetyltransferase involved in cellulose biosynthesis
MECELTKPVSASPVTAGARVRIVDPVALTPALANAWDELANLASEPNAFAERWCLAPALQMLDAGRRTQLLMIELGAELIAVTALIEARRYGPLPLRHWTNWVHSNHFHGAPLVRAGRELQFWQAIGDWCAEQGAFLLQWQRLTTHGPLHMALDTWLGLQQRSAPVVHGEARALLASNLSPADYWEAAVRGKKRKELRRQAARLAEAGALDQRQWQAGEAIAPWATAFLELEARGWKGREGSALACDSATEAWFHTILAGAGTAGRLNMRMLTQQDRPLAMLINFLCPPGGFSFKTAYAEDAARFSPGVLLQQANLALLERDDLAWVDSCAAPDHPMIDSIWRERRGLVWVNIPLGGAAAQLRFAALMRAERLWHGLRRRSPLAAGGAAA